MIDRAPRLRGVAPTYREIASHLGSTSTNGVAEHLEALKRKGWLIQAAGTTRALIPIIDDDGKDEEIIALVTARKVRPGVDGADAAAMWAVADVIALDLDPASKIDQITRLVASWIRA